jgi:hypothetical protein
MRYETTTIMQAMEKAINVSLKLFFSPCLAFTLNKRIKSRTSKMQDNSTSQGKIKAKNKRTSSITIFGSSKYKLYGI